MSKVTPFSDSFSLYVDCADQAEVDGYWDKIVQAGGTPSARGFKLWTLEIRRSGPSPAVNGYQGTRATRTPL